MWIQLLRAIIALISPELRKALCDALAKLYEAAQETENPWDDIAVDLLMKILGCSR